MRHDAGGRQRHLGPNTSGAAPADISENRRKITGLPEPTQERVSRSDDEKIEILRREIGIGVEQARQGRFSKQSVADLYAEIDAEER